MQAELERAQLLAAFTQLFRALRDPEFAPLAHPPAPGTTLPLGARVPGTSLELEPATAAACLGALLHAAPEPVEAALAPALAAADYAARRAHYEGREPPTLQHVYAALARARVHARATGTALAAGAGHDAADPWRAGRAAGAFAAASLLGADDAACDAAARAAALDAAPKPAAAAPLQLHAAAASDDTDALQQRADARALATQVDADAAPLAACRAAGENAARALRHALEARAAAPGGAQAECARIGPLAPAPCLQPSLPQVESRFRAAAEALFPARYLPGVLAPFADDQALRALPVDALLARLVRN